MGLAPPHSILSLATSQAKSFLNPLRGSTPTAAALRRAARCMKEAGQSHRDPRLPIGEKPRSNPGHGGGMRRASGGEVASTERLSPRRRLRRSTWVGAWNVMYLSEVRDKRTGEKDCHLPQLFAELGRLGVCQCSRSLRSQETWERVSQWGGYTYCTVRPSTGAS